MTHQLKARISSGLGGSVVCAAGMRRNALSILSEIGPLSALTSPYVINGLSSAAPPGRWQLTQLLWKRLARSESHVGAIGGYFLGGKAMMKARIAAMLFRESGSASFELCEPVRYR